MTKTFDLRLLTKASRCVFPLIPHNAGQVPLGWMGDNAADDRPPAAWRCTPHNQRMRQPIPSASLLASLLFRSIVGFRLSVRNLPKQALDRLEASFSYDCVLGSTKQCSFRVDASFEQLCGRNFKNSYPLGGNMHLDRLAISNFRSFDKIEIPLCKDLTVFVGENNGGKSNAIDAIRLITTPLGGRREIYAELTDIRFSSLDRRFEIEALFSQLSPAQQGRLISATTDLSLQSARFTLTYDANVNSYPVRATLCAGKGNGTPEPGCHEMIRHVYLPPLRDAKRALASGDPTRIYALLRHFLDNDNPDELANRLARHPTDPILCRIDSSVEACLTALSSGVRQQVASLGFAKEEKLIDIARDLRFRLADHGIEPEDLRYSGHGCANLLYMATIAVELEKVNNADLTLFLVEEPEAHLHPQLQAAVLNFLEEQAEKSKIEKPDKGPAGQIQVIVATHSPNLTAWVESKKLVYFRSFMSANCDPPAEQKKEQVEKAAPRCSTLCIPLAKLNLTDIERRKIDRYLDVTKAAFLFGGRVLLVEGIAEALLLPIIAKKFVLKDKPEKLRLFRSAVFVPIDGVDFEPYVKLLLGGFKDVRVADRVVVMTDGDRTKAIEGKTSPGEIRKATLETLARNLGASPSFEVVLNNYSLESELVIAGNGDLLKKVFLHLHKNSESKWDAAVVKTGDEQAKAIQALFESTRKGDFAQILADQISEGADFIVPGYIKQAIEALVK